MAQVVDIPGEGTNGESLCRVTSTHKPYFYIYIFFKLNHFEGYGHGHCQTELMDLHYAIYFLVESKVMDDRMMKGLKVRNKL